MSRLSIGNACVALLCAAAAAQAAEPAAAPVKCATLLTAAEVQKALGAGAQDAGQATRNPGETECAWMLRKDGAFKAVSLQFYDASLIAGSSTPTAEAFYEDLLAPIENMNKVKREPLSGIGQAAAFVFAEPQMLVVVRRADGIARIVGNNLTKAQITAVAKAVATD